MAAYADLKIGQTVSYTYASGKTYVGTITSLDNDQFGLRIVVTFDPNEPVSKIVPRAVLRLESDLERIVIIETPSDEQQQVAEIVTETAVAEQTEWQHKQVVSEFVNDFMNSWQQRFEARLEIDATLCASSRDWASELRNHGDMSGYAGLSADQRQYVADSFRQTLLGGWLTFIDGQFDAARAQAELEAEESIFWNLRTGVTG